MVKIQQIKKKGLTEGLDKIIENKKWDNIKINSSSEANMQLKKTRDKLGLAVSTLSDYYTDAKNTLDQLLDFNDQNVAVIQSDIDESEIRVTLDSAKFEIESFVSKILNKFVGTMISMPGMSSIYIWSILM